MASAGTILRHGARRWQSLPPLTPNIAAVGFGMLFGFAGLALADMETRWLTYALAGLAFITATLAGNVRRNLVAYFVVGLSLNLTYYITAPERMLAVGMSSPNCFQIPIVLIPAAALAVFAALDAKTGRMAFRWGLPLSKFAVLVIATTTISALLSSVRRYGLYVVADMLQWLLIFIVAVNIVRTQEDVALVIRLLLVTLAIQCAVFLLQEGFGLTFTMSGRVVGSASGGLNRGGGTVSATPSGYAIFVEPLVFTAFALWRIRESGVSRPWVGCLAAVGSATLILTLNRTSWVTLLLGGSLVEITCRRYRIARRLSGAAVLGVAAVFILAAVVLFPLILPRLTAQHGMDWEIRSGLMGIALRVIAANPVVGVGPGAYPYYVHAYASPHVDWLWVVHNEYLLVWAERGLLGFVAWLAWMRAGLRQAVQATTVQTRQFQALGIGCLAGFVGLLWEYTLNMFPSYGCYALLWFLFGVLVAGNDLYAKPKCDYPDFGGRRGQLSGVAG